jgi:NitT/TauT family transport system permease protein
MKPGFWLKAEIVFWRVAILIVVLAVWQWGYELRHVAPEFTPGVLDPYFISKPSEIWTRLLALSCINDAQGHWHFFDEAMRACLAANRNNLWIATAVTLKNTFWGFALGVSTGVAGGLLLGRSEPIAQVLEPYIIAFNSVPRIALVPLIVLMFGLGDLSKIMTAWVVVFFLIFFNTFEGVRAVDRDYLAAARLLGASQLQLLRTVVIPSAMAWVFASLSPAISFSLIGVIVGEFIGSEQGLGRFIQEAQARAVASDMMVAIFVLMIVGVLLTIGIKRIQAHLLRWQPHFQQPS